MFPGSTKSRGWFAVGAEGISKPMNLGAIMRTSHAFGASFVFTLGAHHRVRDVHKADTSKTHQHVPYFDFDSPDALMLPRDCRLVGVELTADSIDLPTFRHPQGAAYVFGREKGSLTPEMQEKCEFIVQIPTRFCINVGTAVAITLYDRTLVMGGWPDRPVKVGGPELGDQTEWKRPGRPES